MLLIFHLAAYDVEQLGGYALLAQLVVFKLQLLEQVLCIIIRALHGHDAGGLFGGAVFGKYFLHHREQKHRQHRAEYRGCVRLEDVGTALCLDPFGREGRGIDGQILLIAQTLTAHTLKVHVEELDSVNPAREKLLSETSGKGLDDLIAALGIDFLRVSHGDVGVVELGHGLVYLAADGEDGEVDPFAILGATLFKSGEQFLEDVDVVASAQSVVRSEHHYTHTLYLARLGERRRELGVGTQQIADYGLYLPAVGQLLPQVGLGTVHLGRGYHLHGSGDFLTGGH